jgi:hypothetical protein
MNAFLTFNRGLLKMPPAVQAWLVLLLSVNLLAPLFLFETLEARVVLATMLTSVLLMTWITAAAGFSRLLGLGHILWVPLVVFLWRALPEYSVDTLVGVWLRAVIALNTASLVIDAIDVRRYVRGDRGEVA